MPFRHAKTMRLAYCTVFVVQGKQSHTFYRTRDLFGELIYFMGWGVASFNRLRFSESIHFCTKQYEKG